MRNKTVAWDSIISDNDFTFEAKAVIDGKEYHSISAPVVERSLMSSALGVGSCSSATLSISVLTEDDIAPSSSVVVMGRVTNGIDVSEWKEFGTFFISQRDTSYDNLVTLSGYDAMLKAEQSYTTEADTSEAWPKAMSAVVSEIAQRIGVDVDSRTVIKSGADYQVPFPSNLTLKQVLGYIGACHGGNWVITEDNKLRLITLADSLNGKTDTVPIPAILGKLNTGVAITITGVTYESSDTSYMTGDDTGAVVKLGPNPYVTDSVCDLLYEELLGATYLPFEISGAIFDPALEIGDSISIKDTVYGTVMKLSLCCDIAFRADISAPSSECFTDEFPYVSEQQVAIKRAASTADAAMTVAETAKEAADKAQVNVDALSVAVSSQSAQISEKADSVELTAYKSEVVRTLGGYYTAKQTDAAIELKADSITSTVSEKINSLQVGGRNLLLDTETALEINETTDFKDCQSAKTYSLIPVVKDDAKAFLLSLRNGEALSLSFDVNVPRIYKSDAHTLNRIGAYFQVSLTHTDGTVTKWYGTHASDEQTITSKHSFEFTDSLQQLTSNESAFIGHYACYVVPSKESALSDFYDNPDDYTVEFNAASVNIYGYTTGGYIKNVKLEVGNIPTDWTPASEDTEKRISSVESSITQTAEAIKSEVKETLEDYSTTSKMQSAIDQMADSITSTVTKVSEKVDALQVGGRNLLLDTDIMYERTNTATDKLYTKFRIAPEYDLQSIINNNLILSYYLHCPGDRDSSLDDDIGNRFGMHGTLIWADSTGVLGEKTQYICTEAFTVVKNNTRIHQSYTVTPPDGYDTLSDVRVACYAYAKPASDNDEIWEIGYPQLEVGNKATDWTPAPEDAETDISDAAERLDKAESTIQQLVDRIQMLVVDDNNTSLFEQTSKGYSYSFYDTAKLIEELKKSVSGLDENDTSISELLSKNKEEIESLQDQTAYIDMKKDDDGNAYLELGNRNDTDGFKVRITKSAIVFSHGSNEPIRLENKDGVGWVVADKLQVDEELVLGGFVWQIRNNGNLGLIWKGVNE